MGGWNGGYAGTNPAPQVEFIGDSTLLTFVES